MKNPFERIEPLRPGVEFELISETPAPEVRLEAAEEIEVELLTDEQALQIGIQPAAYKGDRGERGEPGAEGAPGRSPRINESDIWEVYDNTTGAWLSTGVSAHGDAADYGKLVNRPSINGVELIGNRTAAQLDLENQISNEDIEALFRS